MPTMDQYAAHFADELAAARARIAELEAKLSRIVNSYDAEVFMRTADMHPADCECLRCAVDAAR